MQSNEEEYLASFSGNKDADGGGGAVRTVLVAATSVHVHRLFEQKFLHNGFRKPEERLYRNISGVPLACHGQQLRQSNNIQLHVREF